MEDKDSKLADRIVTSSESKVNSISGFVYYSTTRWHCSYICVYCHSYLFNIAVAYFADFFIKEEN